jgi:Peptidase family M28
MKNLPGAGRNMFLSSNKPYWILTAIAVCFFVAPLFGADLGRQNGQDDAAIEARLKQTVEYLASDELQGRGPRTEGIDRAADFIAKRMGKIGLKTDLFQGSPFQSFYARPPNEEGEGLDLNLNIFSFFGDTIYTIFVKIGDSSPQKESSEIPVLHSENSVKLKNVVGMFEGHGPLAEETIVIGAHYDHLGERKGPNGETIVYHGANDNASGVAVMLETADILAHRQQKLRRRIVFVAFSGEELGMLGSFHYVNYPAVPLDKTIAMINLDMVGRLENNKLTSMGASKSPTLAKTLDKIVKRHNLTLDEMPWVYPISDHAGFYAHRIPEAFLMTWSGWGEYHQPTDTANTLNYAGMRKVAQVDADLVAELAETEQRPELSEESIGAWLYRDVLLIWSWLSD